MMVTQQHSTAVHAHRLARMRVTRSVAGLCMAVGLGGACALYAPLASALPPGGAGASTPGTGSSVPSEVRCGDTLNWEVNGFAANVEVNVKVDDGLQSGNDSSVQGTGVVSTAMSDSNGSASGSFVYDCAAFGDGPGHWLRFLATGAAPQRLGYTHRSNDFTAIADTAPAQNSGNSPTNSGDNTSNNTGGRDNANAPAADNGTQNTNANPQNAAGGNGPDQVVEETVVEDAGPGQNSGAGANNTSAGSNSNANRRITDNSAPASSTNRAVAGGESGSGSGPLEVGGGPATDDVSTVAATEDASAPVMGLIIGGAIILVGLVGSGVYFYTQRTRSRSAQQ